MSVTRSHKASLDADVKNDISTLFKDEMIKAMNSEEMKSAISNQVKQLIKSELNSIVKPLEDDLASIKAENSRLRVELVNIQYTVKKQNTTFSLHANANEQYTLGSIMLEYLALKRSTQKIVLQRFQFFSKPNSVSLLMTLMLTAFIELEDEVFLLLK